MRPLKTQKEHCGKVAKSALRINDAQAARCERSLGQYLDGIIKWHPGFASKSSRAEAVEEIANTLRVCHRGQTFIEQVYVNWRYAMQLRARVLEISAKQKRIEAAPGNLRTASMPAVMGDILPVV